jgi:threonine dehydrogenase-like Zn-dependent dehydrogenase
MYEGRTDVEQGKVLGHENMGVVEAVGDAVGRIRVGDRVSLPFNIACGTCENCIRASPGSASARTRAAPAPPTATPAWAPTTAARPTTCGSRGPTSTP